MTMFVYCAKFAKNLELCNISHLINILYGNFYKLFSVDL